MKLSSRISPDVVVAGVLLVAAVLSIVFIAALVAPPKTLLGRSMTAITPSMFPKLTLSLLALLSAAFLVRWFLKPPAEELSGFETQEWKRGLLFFALLIFYALAMKPLGFLISTALAMAAVSLLVGNRSAVQIVLLSVVSPIALYLASTRLLVVALPELSFIEFLYARLLG